MNPEPCYACELDPAYRKGLCCSCYFRQYRKGAVSGEYRNVKESAWELDENGNYQRVGKPRQTSIYHVKVASISGRPSPKTG